MTQKEFIQFYITKGYSYDGDKTISSPQQTGEKTGRPIKTIISLGKFNAKRHIVFQDDFKKTTEKAMVDYSQLEIVDGKLTVKAPEEPKPEVFEDTTGKEMRYCKTCNGTGLVRSFDDSFKECRSCHGAAKYYAPDFSSLIKFIMGRKGLKSAAPTRWHFTFPSSARAFWIWRMVRFNAGLDVRMPCNASLAINGDPFYEELDKAAEYIAKRVYGTNIAGAHRWGRALGYLNQDLDGLPITAYQCGPEKLA